MAKGVEDTAFYSYNRLSAMNEVGADPACNGSTIEEFHVYNAKMQATHPLTMTTLSTHDTKRSEDVRARMAVLSETPEIFAQAIKLCSELSRETSHGRRHRFRHRIFLLSDPHRRVAARRA